MMQRIPNEGIILLRNWQRLQVPVTPDRYGEFPPWDKLFHQGRLLIMLDNMLYAFHKLGIILHHRMQVYTNTAVIGQRFDNGRKTAMVKTLRPGKDLITRRRQMGNCQFLLHTAFIDAGFYHTCC